MSTLGPALEQMGLDFWGNNYAHDFEFTNVLTKAGDPVDTAQVKQIIGGLREQDREAKRAERAKRPRAKPETDVEPPPVDHPAWHSPPPGSMMGAQFGLWGVPRMGKTQVKIDLPSLTGLEVITGTEGDRAFIEFASQSPLENRSVRVSFPAKRAMEVAMGAAGLIYAGAAEAAREFMSDALREPARLAGVLELIPTFLEELASIPGAAGRGAERLLHYFQSVPGFAEWVGAAPTGEPAEEPEEKPEEETRPSIWVYGPEADGPVAAASIPTAARCPQCGAPGRPTGRTVGARDACRGKESGTIPEGDPLRPVGLFVCDSRGCVVNEFTSFGVYTHKPDYTPPVIVGDVEPPPLKGEDPPDGVYKCPECGEPGRATGRKKSRPGESGMYPVMQCANDKCPRYEWTVEPGKDEEKGRSIPIEPEE